MTSTSFDSFKHPDLHANLRRETWLQLHEVCEQFYDHTADLPVTPLLDKKTIAGFAQKYSFDAPIGIAEAIDHVAEGLKTFAVHTPHPKYYGLFNPRPNFASIVADSLTAFFNPQMAAWSHAPFAVEAEEFVIRQLGQKFGYAADDADGVFTSGGAEANHTALLSALTHHFPEYGGVGLQGLPQRPVFYASAEAHHSFLKAAMNTGLGRNSLRCIPVKTDLSLDVEALEKQIIKDQETGHTPFMVVATLGTTGAGGMDSIEEIQVLAKTHHLWVHADAAYGGGFVLSDRFRHLLGPIHMADSITFDAHKWMSVPMGAGIFLTRHPDILHKTFGIHTSYMPHDEAGEEVTDPYVHSIQWSRRFTGLKVYLALLVLGWKGYEQIIDHCMEAGHYFKSKLNEAGFDILNQTPLPIICFRPREEEFGKTNIEKLHHAILEDRRMWLSLYPVHGLTCLRVCITNYNTSHGDIDQSIAQILDLLNVQVDQPFATTIKL